MYGGVPLEAGRGLTHNDVEQIRHVYNLRAQDEHLQAGMADAQAAKHEKHKYSVKSNNNLKSRRTPSPKYDVEVEPMTQRAKLPYGTQIHPNLSMLMSSSASTNTLNMSSHSKDNIKDVDDMNVSTQNLKLVRMNTKSSIAMEHDVKVYDNYPYHVNDVYDKEVDDDDDYETIPPASGLGLTKPPPQDNMTICTTPNVPTEVSSPSGCSNDETMESMRSHTTAPSKPKPTPRTDNIPTPKRIGYESQPTAIPPGFNQKMALIVNKLNDTNAAMEKIHEVFDGTGLRTTRVFKELKLHEEKLVDIAREQQQIKSDLRLLRGNYTFLNHIDSEVMLLHKSTSELKKDIEANLTNDPSM
jgi:hypothetical protein